MNRIIALLCAALLLTMNAPTAERAPAFVLIREARVVGECHWTGEPAQGASLTLMRSGQAVKTAWVTAESGWKFAFTGLADNNGYGLAYDYTVECDSERLTVEYECVIIHETTE